MLPFGTLKKASKSQEDGATLVASDSEDVDDYFLDEFYKTTKEKKMNKMRGIFTSSKIKKQDSASSDELSDDEGGQIPLCVADDFDFISSSGGLARFDYKALTDDLGNFANAIFPNLNNSQSHVHKEKEKSKDGEARTNILQNEDGNLIVDNSNGSSNEEDDGFSGRPGSIVNLVKSISNLKGCNCSHDAGIPSEIKTRKMIPKKVKVTGTLGLSRVQRTNNVVPNSTLSPRNRTNTRPKSKEGRLSLPDSFSRSMSNVLLSGRHGTSSGDSENDDFKENEPKIPREQLRRVTKDYNSAVNSAASQNIINEQRIQRGLSFAGRKDRKDMDLKTSVFQGSHNWMKHSNSKKVLKNSKSESSSISSSRHRRSHDNSSKESRNKNSVVISHVDGSRVVRSRVAVMQGLK